MPVAGGEMVVAGMDLAGGGQSADENFFRFGNLGFGGGFDGGGFAGGGGVAEFLAQDGGIDGELLRDLVGQLVAHDAAGHALDVRQEIVDGLLFAFAAADGELRAGAFDEVIEIFL